MPCTHLRSAKYPIMPGIIVDYVILSIFNHAQNLWCVTTCSWLSWLEALVHILPQVSAETSSLVFLGIIKILLMWVWPCLQQLWLFFCIRVFILYVDNFFNVTILCFSFSCEFGVPDVYFCVILYSHLLFSVTSQIDSQIIYFHLSLLTYKLSCLQLCSSHIMYF